MSSTLTKKDSGVKLLSFLCPLIYFASYLTRKNYSVVLSEIIISEGISNADASLAVTLSLISYGAGQIISGILGDKFKPQNIILCGLTLTTLMNLAMPLCSDFYLRGVIWLINGFAQSMLWPPLVRIMAATMDAKTYNDVCTNVNVAGISATIFLYLTASTIWIKYFSWKYVFFFSAFTCTVIIFIWLWGMKKITKKFPSFSKKQSSSDTAAQPKQKLTAKKLFASGFIFIGIAIIAQGALRDGISDWVPTFIINTFNLESSGAILKSILIPVFGVLSLKAVGIINGKFVKNEVNGASITFFSGLLGCVILLLCYTKNQYVTLVVSALITGVMHAVNFFLICIVPARFEKYGIVATISGLINSLTYVGSAAATYGFGAIADNFGWNASIITWCAVALIGTLCCFIAVRPWKKFVRE